MALIIEDGSIVPGANSFVSVAECRTFCGLRGLTLPTTDPEVEILLIKAIDYLFSIEAKFQGYRSDTAQELLFPRDGVVVFGSDVSGEIPANLKKAQCRLAFDVSENDLQATGVDREVIKTKLGPLEKQYAPTGSTNYQFKPTAALSILEPLFSTAYQGGINIAIVR